MYRVTDDFSHNNLNQRQKRNLRSIFFQECHTKLARGSIYLQILLNVRTPLNLFQKCWITLQRMSSQCLKITIKFPLNFFQNNNISISLNIWIFQAKFFKFNCQMRLFWTISNQCECLWKKSQVSSNDQDWPMTKLAMPKGHENPVPQPIKKSHLSHK